MSVAMDVLRATVERTQGVIESTIVLIAGLRDQILGAKEDPAAIEAIAAQLANATQQLADAVAANSVNSVPPPTQVEPPAPESEVEQVDVEPLPEEDPLGPIDPLDAA